MQIQVMFVGWRKCETYVERNAGVWDKNKREQTGALEHQRVKLAKEGLAFQWIHIYKSVSGLVDTTPIEVASRYNANSRYMNRFPLCRRAPKSINYLLVHCCNIVWLWGFIKDWLGLHSIDLQQWPLLNIKEWWWIMSDSSTPNRKSLASMVFLVSWKICNERNVCVLQNKHTTSLSSSDN
jgi:hypothetical protein